MRKALVVIDMLQDFMSEGGALYCGPEARRVVGPIRGKLEAFREAGDPVIFVCDRHRPEDAEFDVFPLHCVEGTPGAEVIGELEPREGEVIVTKRRYSGFFGTDLDITLRELEVGELVLVGVCTDICVLYTAADARNLGYSVTVPADCVASFDDEAHEFALRAMERTLGVKVAR